MNKREQQRDARREQILRCCLDKIITHGYAGMKLRDVAAELRVSPGLLFNYFESKEQIYLELVRMGISGPTDLLGGMIGAVREPLALFGEITAAIFRAVRQDPFTAKMFVLMGRTQTSGDVPPAVRAAAAGLDAITPLIPVVLEGQRQGTVKQGDPAALLWAFWAAVQGIASMQAICPDIPMPESGWIVDILRA